VDNCIAKNPNMRCRLFPWWSIWMLDQHWKPENELFVLEEKMLIGATLSTERSAWYIRCAQDYPISFFRMVQDAETASCRVLFVLLYRKQLLPNRRGKRKRTTFRHFFSYRMVVYCWRWALVAICWKHSQLCATYALDSDTCRFIQLQTQYIYILLRREEHHLSHPISVLELTKTRNTAELWSLTAICWSTRSFLQLYA